MPLGQVKGAYDEYLEPGVYRDVEVPLFEDVTCYEFERDRLEESTELMAMPHRDEPHDEEYTHLCTHGEEETEDSGFGDFPDVVQDTALVEVPPDGRGDPSSDGTKNRSLDR